MTVLSHSPSSLGGGAAGRLWGALREGTEEQSSAVVAHLGLWHRPSAPDSGPCTVFPQLPRVLTAEAADEHPHPSLRPVSLSPPEFPGIALDLHLLRHPFKPLAPCLLCPQPIPSLGSWPAASSVWKASLSRPAGPSHDCPILPSSTARLLTSTPAPPRPPPSAGFGLQTLRLTSHSHLCPPCC